VAEELALLNPFANEEEILAKKQVTDL